jgi:hypothetical protein
MNKNLIQPERSGDSLPEFLEIAGHADAMG